MNGDRDSSETAERILVIRPGALGDTILTLPLLSTLRDVHPLAEITLLGTRAYKDLIPAGTLFEPFDSGKWLSLFGDGTEGAGESAERFQAAYVILNRPDAVTSGLRRAGVASIKEVPSIPRKGMHLVEHMHKGLGLPIPPRAPCLRHLGPPETRDLIWVHPGSGGPRKCVPLGVMLSCVERLRAGTGWDVVVTAGEEDAFLRTLPEWHELVQGPHTVVMESRPLLELCAEFGSARIFLGNDSGIAHMAAGLGIFSVVFFVHTDPLQWAPWVPRERLRVLDLRGPSAPAAASYDFLDLIINML